MELAARQYAEVYRRVKELQAGGGPILPRARRVIRLQEKAVLVKKWQDWLDKAEFGRRTVDAVQPCLAEWLSGRRHGLSYHAVQVLTEHGCFGKYLHRIGKEATTECHHCDEVEDTAQHTLEVCPAWAAQRRVLQGKVGNDLSLPAVVAAAVENETKWRAFLAFCGSVMSQKEASERIRRGEVRPPSDRQGRRGGGVDAEATIKSVAAARRVAATIAASKRCPEYGST
ncbi:uncharacterized protein [Temnothorax longispinosus]|uniref:uncharacterized protein n=1 Tax=Temnothorax longispinosus TaxID=300112 RepID=UPI003A991CF3